MNRWTEFAVDSGVTLLIGLLVTLGGVRAVARVLQFASDASPQQQQQAAERLKGGAWIGALERCAAYLCVVGHHLGGLAVVIAVKGLARFPDLKGQEPAVTERFIIGTFLSVLLAVGAGALTLWLTSLT